MAATNEYELLPHMRIDFSIIPIRGETCYSWNLTPDLKSSIRKLVGGGGDGDDDDNIKIYICGGKTHFRLRMRTFGSRNSKSYDKQLRDGDPGYVVIRSSSSDSDGDGLGSFVDGFEGDDWDEKFRNARSYIMKELNCKVFDNGRQLLIARLHPSEDAQLFNALVCMDTTSRPSTVVVNKIPSYWLVPDQRQSLRNFFHSLAKIRDLNFSRNDVSIQFKNHKQCYKALKKLCSHSLIRHGYGKPVDYELSLKDESLAAIDEMLTYKKVGHGLSATAQAVDTRVAMLEKEFNTVKSIMDKYEFFKGSVVARALNHRATKIEENLLTVNAIVEDFGPELLHSEALIRQRVLVLKKEVNTARAVLEEYKIVRVDKVQALEMRVQALEEELKNMKESKESHIDQALKRCKCLRRD